MGDERIEAEEPAGEVGPGMPDDLEELLEQADEEAVEEADEGRFDAPPLPPLLILAVVGLLAGFVTVALVWLSERGCDRVRDSPNCGTMGFPLLVLTVVITIVLAAVTLTRLAMPHPKLVAFLGVAFMLLIVLAFLSDDLFSTWTLLVVPVLTAVTFLVAHLIAGRLERADA
jgi:prepilin signal peptidase PulO-like enzyme (type II secretory pathway)